ncbi:MAG: GGDEF domain-containing protein [Lachnospiraceae bacterium]|nr:GGDEF domain-containing protein [Lachnospiraceae bacterium]
MPNKALEDYTVEEAASLVQKNVDAIILVDTDMGKYKALSRKGIFKGFIDETGDYNELIEKLWFHFSGTNEKITKDYAVFVSYYGEFKGKYSRRLKVQTDGSDQPSIIQMTVYPMKDSNIYLFVMDELDDDEYVQEFMTTNKVNTIQNAYLFSMYIDLVRDTTSSLNITEVSDESVNSDIKYSDWRMMIVNMFKPEDQEQFLRRSDPEYLKKNFPPGRTSSFDCMMMNLEGNFIWVKLIFSRAETNNEDDYRFVFMVQDIHDNSIELLSTLKKYEKLALTDPLTEVLNHGGIKAEIYNAIDNHKRDGEQTAVLMLDLDLFKNVNDTYGHSVGDATLKLFADIIKDRISEEKAYFGRWGGEEFVIVCYGKSDAEIAQMAENLRGAVEDRTFPEVGKMTCSVGATRLKDDDTFESVFDRVDKALYSSKENGRNKVTVL